MRLKIVHETEYRYETPAMSVAQILRMTPRGSDAQFVVDWRVEIDRDNRLQTAADAFGNITHSFALAGPIDSILITATGEVETDDTHGVLRGLVERLPSTVFLRDTDLTRSDAGIREFARTAAAGEPDQLALLHSLNDAIFRRMRFDTDRTHAATLATEAFEHGHGVCQDYAHIFIAAARHLGIPARYVGGYLYRAETLDQEAGHGWAEALVDGFGWVAFDPANGVSATDAYVRVAVGLDYLGAAPIRGARYGGGDETLSVQVRVQDIGIANRTD